MAPKNNVVDDINLRLLAKMPCRERQYKSVDKVMEDAEATEYPVEFLNSLELPGVPSHNLKLKEGAPIMLLRNLDAPKLVNGTRLVVKKLLPHVIQATILCGEAKGEDVFIPRIPIIPSDVPFNFKRIQFPVRLCFAMSINKSQGRSLKFSKLFILTCMNVNNIHCRANTWGGWSTTGAAMLLARTTLCGSLKSRKPE